MDGDNKAPAANEIKRFTFNGQEPFNGKMFYEKFMSATFLQEGNIRKCFARMSELEAYYNDLKPGGSFIMDGMFLEPEVPLVLKKSKLDEESDVDQDDFTLRRLLGLMAVHVYKNLNYFGDLYIPEAETSGFANRDQKILCLCALPGTELFDYWFYYYPLLFALRNYQRHQTILTQKRLLLVSSIPDSNMIPAAVRCARNFREAVAKAQIIGFDLKKAIVIAPQSVKFCFTHLL